MINLNIRKILLRYATTGFIALLIAGAVYSAEFSADVKHSITSDRGTFNTNDKLYVRGNIKRQEIEIPYGKQIIIVRPDKGLMWVLTQKTKTYIEIPLADNSDKPKSIESILKQMPNAKKVGSAKIENYQCDEYQSAEPKLEIKEKVFISTKLQEVLKRELTAKNNKITYQLTNIKEEKLPDELFELPKDYKIPTTPMPNPKPEGRTID